jgi:NADH-quinone oxidoreductase subunit D/NADH-quinone oxidoreductase subunit C/D
MVTGIYHISNRMRGVGIIAKKTPYRTGVLDRLQEVAGVQCDIRKLFPYELYNEVEFDEILETPAIHLRVTWCASGK